MKLPPLPEGTTKLYLVRRERILRYCTYNGDWSTGYDAKPAITAFFLALLKRFNLAPNDTLDIIVDFDTGRITADYFNAKPTILQLYPLQTHEDSLKEALGR